MNLIFLGAPGVGKGTQAEAVAKRLSVPIIGTGAMLREAIKNGTELGKKVAACINQGNLIPDEVINGLVSERLSQKDCADGFILDGVPRTVPQAEALTEMGIHIDRVIEICVADDVIVERLAGRRTCPNCGAAYHTTVKPPVNEGICDVCQSQLTVRRDDDPQTIQNRLEVYHTSTEPLSEYYARLGKLRKVDGHGEVREVTRFVLAAIED